MKVGALMSNHRPFAACSEVDLLDEFVEIYCPDLYRDPDSMEQALSEALATAQLFDEVETLRVENRFLKAKLATVMDQVAALRAMKLQGGTA